MHSFAEGSTCFCFKYLLAYYFECMNGCKKIVVLVNQNKQKPSSGKSKAEKKEKK